MLLKEILQFQNLWITLWGRGESGRFKSQAVDGPQKWTFQKDGKSTVLSQKKWTVEWNSSKILSLTNIGRLSLRSMTDISISNSSVPSCNVDQTKDFCLILPYFNLIYPYVPVLSNLPLDNFCPQLRDFTPKLPSDTVYPRFKLTDCSSLSNKILI